MASNLFFFNNPYNDNCVLLKDIFGDLFSSIDFPNCDILFYARDANEDLFLMIEDLSKPEEVSDQKRNQKFVNGLNLNWIQENQLAQQLYFGVHTIRDLSEQVPEQSVPKRIPSREEISQIKNKVLEIMLVILDRNEINELLKIGSTKLIIQQRRNTA